MFRCPCHEDRVPSCSIRDDGLVTCFGGCPREQVLAALDAMGFTDDQRRSNSPADRRELKEQQIRRAQRMWEDAAPASHDGRLAWALRQRGITLPVPPVLRPWRNNGHVCAVQQPDGAITAVQVRDCYFPGTRRTTHGHLGRGAVRLTEPTGDELGLAEGVETALSATQLFGVPCWAVLGSRRMDGAQLPDTISRVHVFADNDESGRAAAAAAVRRYTGLGRHVTVRWPPPEHKDWNDVLRGRTTS
jgi:hypothetical protein